MTDKISEKLVQLSLRLPKAVHQGVHIAAARAGESMNTWVTRVLRHAEEEENETAFLKELAERGISPVCGEQ